MGSSEKVGLAMRAVRRAEEELHHAVTAAAPARRAEKVEMSVRVRAAFEQLRKARAALEQLEAPGLRENRDGARASVVTAEGALDTLLRDLEIVDQAETTWITDRVEQAFSVLRAANLRLARLERQLHEEEE